MIRLLLFLLGTVSFSRPGGRDGALFRPDARRVGTDQDTAPELVPGRTEELDDPDRRGRDPRRPGPLRQGPRRRRIPRWLKLSAALVLIGLIFRRAIAS